MPGSLFQIERLVNRSIEVEHEMNAQVPHIVQNLEALPARAGGIKMNYELVHHRLQQRQIPASAAHMFGLLRCEHAASEPVPVWTREFFDLCFSSFPIRFVNRTETPFDAVCIVTSGVHPENHRSAGM